MTLLPRRAWLLLVALASTVPAACSSCTHCAEDEVQRDGHCVRPCNNDVTCTGVQHCENGACVDGAPAGSASSGGSSSSAGASSSVVTTTSSTMSSSALSPSSAASGSSGSTAGSSSVASSSSAAVSSSEASSSFAPSSSSAYVMPSSSAALSSSAAALSSSASAGTSSSARPAFGGIFSNGGDNCIGGSCYIGNQYTNNYCTCPAGFTAHAMQVVSDYFCGPLPPPWGWEAISFCYAAAFPADGDFAGAFHTASGNCVEGNPAANNTCACPGGSERVDFPVAGDCWNLETLAVCYRLNAPRTRFAGAYLKSESTADGLNGCVTANPFTGACACPAGTSSWRVRTLYGTASGCFPITQNGAWLHTCYVP